MREKLIKFTGAVFGWGMAVLVTFALLTGAVYVVLFFLGTGAAQAVNAVMTGSILPVVYVSAIVLSFLGIINMYLKRQYVYVLDLPKRKKVAEKAIEENKKEE